MTTITVTGCVELLDHPSHHSMHDLGTLSPDFKTCTANLQAKVELDPDQIVGIKHDGVCVIMEISRPVAPYVGDQVSCL